MYLLHTTTRMLGWSKNSWRRLFRVNRKWWGHQARKKFHPPSLTNRQGNKNLIAGNWIQRISACLCSSLGTSFKMNNVVYVGKLMHPFTSVIKNYSSIKLLSPSLSLRIHTNKLVPWALATVFQCPLSQTLISSIMKNLPKLWDYIVMAPAPVPLLIRTWDWEYFQKGLQTAFLSPSWLRVRAFLKHERVWEMNV